MARRRTVNEHLLNEQIAHQIDLMQFSTGVVRRMIALLNRTDADLFAQLQVALEGRRRAPTLFTVERLELLLGQVRALNTQAYLAIERALPIELQGLVEVEATAQRELFIAAVPPSVVASVAPQVVTAQVASAAMAQPFRGRLLREWTASIAADRMVRIRDAVRIGVVENEPIAAIITRLRGTRDANYRDGLLDIDRRAAEAVVRTAVSHVAGVTRDAVYASQRDLIASIQWVSTLDSRTTEACRIRDGRLFSPETHRPLGHKIPWLSGPGRLHWRCRSSSVPVLKAWNELGLGVDVPAGTRAAMDGQVPEDTTYAEWLQRQSAARQDAILGPTRGRLVREGQLPFDALYTERGRALTLAELRSRRPEVFERAGVD